MPMRQVSPASILVLALGLAAAAPAQDLNAQQLIDEFAKAVAADQFAAMKDLLLKQRKVVRYAWMDGESQYFSAVANKSDADKATRGNVLQKFAQLCNLELKDGWFNDRWRWAQAQDVAVAAKMVKIYEVYDAGDRDFLKASAERTGDLYAACVKAFTELDRLASEVPDPMYVCYANWYLGSSHKGLFNQFEAVYCFKKAIESGREAKLQTLVDRDGNFAFEMKKIAEAAKIDVAKVDLRLPIAEAKAKYEALGSGAPAPTEGAEGAASKPAAGPKPEDDGKPKPPPKAGTPEKAGGKDAIPPRPDAHGGKVDWIEVDKPKVKEVGEKGFLSPFVFSNNPPLRWQTVRVPPGGDVKFPSVPGDNKLLYDKGKLSFDADGGGKAEPEKFKIGTKPEVVKFAKRDYGDGVTGDVWIRMMEQPSTYKLMGFDAKEAPDKDGLNVLYACGMAATTKFEGFEATFYDDNADGRFNSWVEDCVVVAKGPQRRVQPLSKAVYVGDLLYECSIDAAGQHVKFKPWDRPLALLKVDYGAGPGPAFLVAKGVGDVADVAFNLMDARDKWMWVPAGEYQIAGGYFAYGDADKRETITITQGRSGTMALKADQQAVWKLGGADAGFKFLWRADRKDDVIVLKGSKIEVYGAFNERYEHFLPGVFRPTVRAKSGEKGAVFFEKEMARVDEGALRLDGGARFFPKDLEIKAPGKGDVLLQLEETYPKLGKITSAYAVVQ